MIENILKQLEKTECETIKANQDSAVLRCSNSILVKTPNIGWSIFIPAPELRPLQQKVSTKLAKPQYITNGDMIPRSLRSENKVFDFTITDEIMINNNHNSIKSISNENIQKIQTKMKNIENLFSTTSSNKINLFKVHDQLLNELTNSITTFYSNELSSRNNTFVYCESEKNQMQYNSLIGESPEYTINTRCLIPNLKKDLNAIFDRSFKDGFISKHDVRFINSKLSDDQLFLLDGINLYQNGNDDPFLRFSVTNLNQMTQKNFITKVQNLENKFNTISNKEIKKLDEDLFLNSISM